MGDLILGFTTVLQPSMLLIIAAGVLGGIIIGALPGLTATMGVALLVPLTFGMNAVAGLVLLVGIYCGAIYGGSISAILLRTPGTPAAAATVIEGYMLAQKGQAGKALGMSTIASFCGGMFSALALTFIAPQLAKVALSFGPPEYFALALFGLSIISSISGDQVLKGLAAGFFGLLLATIGMDPITGYPRFTFDNANLLSGISFIPVLIGLFAVAEALATTEAMIKNLNIDVKIAGNLPTLAELKQCAKTILKGSAIGTFIGIIPGAGADIAAFVSYGECKRSSRDSDKFGTGVLEGVAAPESANNGVTGGALVPLLTLGVPGDAVAAVMLGALMLQGLKPGPMLFKDNADVVYSLFAGLMLANVFMLLFGLFGIKYIAKVVTVPKPILTPIIFILCVVGSYAINNSLFDVLVMMVFGVIGYLMQKLKFPISPIVLALILGPMAEGEFRRSLVMSQGDPSIFFTRPICLVFFALAAISIVGSYVAQRRKEKTAAIAQ
ncbi:protein of unknown function DUF112, transmembrane [Thermosinus carboxydivorans Nor1]|uniref:DUF112 domain-containing protein n=1 Tax=Thermosinus carboxydivorans Nor1 TaxID=401526 RepID=A1HM24_9FIRM|nr:tripartite tricarboxylate transporter permease [Thermosinus carboxydivorans]EAX48875.1 protein of unknown function DUF112, transmembrane [Thermosinus carboxydivorans Nor1]